MLFILAIDCLFLLLSKLCSCIVRFHEIVFHSSISSRASPSRAMTECEFDASSSDLCDSNEFLQNVNAIDVITPKDVFDCMIEYDSTIHVVGEVIDIEVPTLHGEYENKLLTKFILCNSTGQHVQFFAWDDDAKRISPFLQLNSIIHVDGAFSRKKNPKFSNGNVAMDLTVRSNTLINVLLLKTVEQDNVDSFKAIRLEEACNHNGLIMVRVYVKLPFREDSSPDSKHTYDSGCVADGIHKVEVRLRSNTNPITYKRGEPIQILGRVHYRGNLPYILVENYSDISKIDGEHLKDSDLLKACLIPKRTPLGSSVVCTKKPRMD